MSRILIVYYSRKGENYWNVPIKNLEKGCKCCRAAYERQGSFYHRFNIPDRRRCSGKLFLRTSSAKGINTFYAAATGNS